MATGFTYQVANGKVETLREFFSSVVWVFIAESDVVTPGVIPTERAPSGIGRDLERTRARLAELRAMSPDEIHEAFLVERAEWIDSQEECGRSIGAENSNLARMIEKVESYVPPPALERIKAFMLEQLRSSITEWKPERFPYETPVDWHEDAVNRAESSVRYASHRLERETEATKSWNEFYAAVSDEINKI